MAQKGNFVEDEMMLFRSDAVTGRFYDFGGRLKEQRNTGAKKLTSFASIDENASRPKILRTGPDQNIVLFEIWSGNAYRTTQLLAFDDDVL